MGIDVARLKVTSFAVAGMYSAFAGALYAGVVGNVLSVFRTFDVGKSLFILATVVVGGLGSIAGAFVAGFVYVYLPEYLGRIMSIVYTQVVAGVGLALVIVLVPEGLAGLPRRLAKALRRGERDDEESFEARSGTDRGSTATPLEAGARVPEGV